MSLIPKLSAPTLCHNHTLVFVLENNMAVFIHVQKGDGFQLGGHTASLRDLLRAFQIDQSLNYSMLGGRHLRRQWISARPMARVSLEARWGQNPRVPAYVFKFHIKRSPLAVASLGIAAGSRGTVVDHIGRRLH